MTAWKRPAPLSLVLFIVFLAGLLAGCNGAASNPTASPEPIQPSATAIPTATPEPGSIWFIAPTQSDQSLSQVIDAYLQQAAAQASLTYNSYPEFRPSELPKELKVAVFLDPASDPDPASLAASLPDTQFILIGNGLTQSGANISIIDTQLDQRLFMAGYIATLVANDFRSGGLFSESDPLMAEKQDSFLNGGEYLCGNCYPVYTPLVIFPETGTIPAQVDTSGLESAFDQLNQDRLQTLYLPAEAYDNDFFTYLASQNIAMLGLQSPPDGFANNWISTVQVDVAPALDQLWPTVINGAGGQQLAATVSLNDVNPAWLTPGKENMAKSLISELAGGWVTPRSVQ